MPNIEFSGVLLCFSLLMTFSVPVFASVRYFIAFSGLSVCLYAFLPNLQVKLSHTKKQVFFTHRDDNICELICVHR